MLVEDPICFVNDDNRAFEILQSKFEKIVVTNKWTEVERQQCLTLNSSILFENCMENTRMVKEIEEAEYYSQMEDEIVSCL